MRAGQAVTRRSLVLLAAALAAAALAVPAALADPADDARTASLAFATALFGSDY